MGDNTCFSLNKKIQTRAVQYARNTVYSPDAKLDPDQGNRVEMIGMFWGEKLAFHVLPLRQNKIRT